MIPVTGAHESGVRVAVGGAVSLTIDGNEAAASIAYRLSDVIAIYPITPASPMGELADAWAVDERHNIWGGVPSICEMQSEGGAAGAIHGALQAGAMATTFTASQGLLLMLPNMFKIAGELTAGVIHVAARSVATHALSIFGDHSDVMIARGTGYALLASSSVQEAHDMAAIAHAATLEARVPFLHFFDGFRTSHEIAKIDPIADDVLADLISEEAVAGHRGRALDPDSPVLRGTAQNPDVFMQAREACTPFYADVPKIVAAKMAQLAAATGRSYRPFDYVGHPEAEHVVIAMGSGAQTVEETAKHLAANGKKVGALTVRLYRPFSATHLTAALPDSAKTIGVLDRTKEPGAPAEPLHLDVLAALTEEKGRSAPLVIGGRYGLSSKEVTPTLINAVFDNLAEEAPKNHFTIGIKDDVSHSSLDAKTPLAVEPDDTYRALFYGLGSDGTVSANKSTIKIIGEQTSHSAQGYFVYDSKKAGAQTVSHLRFGDSPIRAPYLITDAHFVACHHWGFISKFPMLDAAREGAVFLLETALPPDAVLHQLPASYRKHIRDKKLRVYCIDARRVAKDAGLGRRINTVMQACFFALSDVLSPDAAIEAMKAGVVKAYGKKGEQLVNQNFAAIDAAVANLHQVPTDAITDVEEPVVAPSNGEALDFVTRVTKEIIAGRGDLLPVSAFPPDGTFPTGTSRIEKRDIADTVPVWDPAVCIQCNKCALVCPHSAIRAKVFDKPVEGVLSVPYKGKDLPAGLEYSLQVAPEDCTGCEMCVEVCPAKNKAKVKLKAINMTPKEEVFDVEQGRWALFRSIPDYDRTKIRLNTIKGSQFLEPLFEFSGACAGCGETPYLKLITQLFGDRMVVANATGCSSIYGGNLPTTPWSADAQGRGPAWSNSLFEDNAEFGLGMRLAIDQRTADAQILLNRLAGIVGSDLVDALTGPTPKDEDAIAHRRGHIDALRARLTDIDTPQGRALSAAADLFVPRSVWIVGGDGWAYDIGFGGLDHVLASGENVNIIVLDTEVYSNTGGQMSKATPMGAVAKFAAGGKQTSKKDLAMMAMSYSGVYVARVAMGASDKQTLQAIIAADQHDGPSLILAYSHCIAHGIDMRRGMDQQKLAVQCGHWPLLRYDPNDAEKPLTLDSKEPSRRLTDYTRREGRYQMLAASRPEVSQRLLTQAEADIQDRYRTYEQLAAGGKEE